MDSVKVAVRVRPFNKREIGMNSKLIIQMTGKQTRLLKRSRESIGHHNNSTDKTGSGGDSNRDKDFHDFTYDHSYWSFDPNDPKFADQQQVYDDLGQDVLNCAFQGYNACVFAYGQTGSGKTYTMMGSANDPGLIPRTCASLFDRIRSSGQQQTFVQYQTTVSYLEIYNERVKDLLDPTHGNNLKILSSNTKGNYVENLSQHTVTCYDEILVIINKGNRLRTTASTNMNDTSSRSHAILTISFTQARFVNEMPSEIQSKIHLVDLAGSECAGTTGATGQRLKEGAHINQSLVTLGIVINKLADKQANGYIAYRDSALTRILKDSLGGNSKTIMIATISPADCNVTETLSTLRYANRAKNIINTPTVNEDSNVRLIRSLREEIQRLREMLNGSAVLRKPSVKEVANLKSLELQEKVLTSEWTEKWSAIQSILNEKDLGLRKCGAGVMLESNGPHLILIQENTHTGVMLYSLAEGRTIIGNGAARTNDDASNNNFSNNRSMITVVGDDILAEHCAIYLEEGRVRVEPIENGACEVNGKPVLRATPLSAGSFLQLGTSNMFRYNNPSAPSPSVGCLGLYGSLMSLSQMSIASKTSTTPNTTIELSDDEMIVVDDNKMRVLMTAQSLTSCDLNSLKDLNARERELLEQKETAMLEKSKLESRLDYDEHSPQLETLSEHIKRLEMHHCQLIRTRRKFEDEALNFGRINRKFSRPDPMTQSMIHLERTSTDRKCKPLPTSASMYNVTDEVPTIIVTHHPKSTNTDPEDYADDDDIDDESTGETIKEAVAPSSFDLTYVSLNEMPPCCAIQSLHQRIAIEKAKLMKNLEDVNCDKRLVDEGIVRLNTLQRQYIAIEKQLEYEGSNGHHCQMHRDHEMCCSTPDKSRVESQSTSNQSKSSGGEYTISIPRFELRGSGSSLHYVYEIAINLDADKWTIMRRYSRIREMHLTMKRRYGDAVAQIRFPRRQFFFAQTEAVAQRRQRQLEHYLRRLLVVCSKMPNSPIYESESSAVHQVAGLQKSALVEFSSFFMRGVCECGHQSETEDSIG